MNYTIKSLNIIQFIKLGKPHLTGSLFFYFSLGALLAVLLNAQFMLSKFLLGWIIIFLSGWAIHYHNDYFDFESDHYTTPTPISGGSGVLIEHPEWRKTSLLMALLLISLAIILSVIFTVIFNYTWTFILFVVMGNILSWFYAAPPVKLSYRGLGEFGNTAIGFLFPAMGYWSIMGTLNIQFLIFVIPLLFLQLTFTNSVEIPDMEADRKAGKWTWIASRGREFGFKLIVISELLALISFLILSFTNIFPMINFYVIAIISLLPLSFGLIGLIRKPSDKKSVNRLCIYNLASVIITIMLINSYLIYLLI